MAVTLMVVSSYIQVTNTYRAPSTEYREGAFRVMNYKLGQGISFSLSALGIIRRNKEE